MKAYLIAANAKRMLDSICIVAVILLTSCGGNSPVSITLKPTPTDITEAVRNSVSAKTYTEKQNTTEWVTVRVPHTCDQYDVDTDRYMPHNPELAKCPRVGATYTKDESHPVIHTVDVSHPCPTLSRADDPAWSVAEIKEDTWRVALSGSSWDVTKVNGGAGGVSDVIHISSFSFIITAYQAC